MCSSCSRPCAQSGEPRAGTRRPLGSEAGIPRRGGPARRSARSTGDPSQYLVRIEDDGFDFFHMTYGEKSLYTRFFADFLRAQQPDVVHLQHSLFVGCELVSLVRRLLPSTPIVYTLHDYMPICHRDGRLVRTATRRSAWRPRRVAATSASRRSPSRTSSCASGSSGRTSTTSTCSSRRATSCSSATSTGASRGRRSGSRNAAALRRYRRRRAGASGPGTGSGFFADLTTDDFEGAEILLQAMGIVRERAPDAHLWLHGTNLGRYPDERQQRFWTLLHGGGERLASWRAGTAPGSPR